MLRTAFILLSSIVSICAISAQVPPSLPLSRIPLPEAWFVSPTQYTNQFFGFSLPLPKDRKFQIEDLSESDKALQHSLFAYKSASKGLTLLTVSATQVFNSPDDEAQKAVFLPGMRQRPVRGPGAVGGVGFFVFS